MFRYILANFDKEDKFILITTTILFGGILVFYYQDNVSCFTPAEFTNSMTSYVNDICSNIKQVDSTRVELSGTTSKVILLSRNKFKITILIMLIIILLSYLMRYLFNIIMGDSMDIKMFLDNLSVLQHHQDSSVICRIKYQLNNNKIIVKNFVIFLWLIGKFIHIIVLIGILIYIQIFVGLNQDNMSDTLKLNGTLSYSNFPVNYFCNVDIRKLGRVSRYTVNCMDNSASSMSMILYGIWFWIIICLLCQIVSLIKWIIRFGRRDIIVNLLQSYSNENDKQKLHNFSNSDIDIVGRFLIHMTLENHGGARLFSQFIDSFTKNEIKQ